MASQLGWTKVARRKGNPAPSSSSFSKDQAQPLASSLPAANPPPSFLCPYLNKPTYTQVLSRKPNPSHQRSNHNPHVANMKGKAQLRPSNTITITTPSPTNSPPRSPRSSSPSVHLIAAPNPGSPTKCRFPPPLTSRNGATAVSAVSSWDTNRPNVQTQRGVLFAWWKDTSFRTIRPKPSYQTRYLFPRKDR